jgi:putative ABC transport system permease protein
MWRATIKSLWAHKLRLAATGTAVLLGVAFTAGTLVLTDTVRRTFDDLFAAVNEGTDAFVRSDAVIGEGGFGEQRARVDAAVVDTVRAVEGVAAAEGNTQGFAQIVGADGEPLGGQGPPTFGFGWSDVDEFNPMVLREGRTPEADDEIVIDRGSAKRGDLSVGDATRVLTKAGVLPVRVVGVATFGTADSPLGATIASFTPAAAQRYVGEPGRYDFITVLAEPGTGEDELRARIAAVVPDGVEVLTGTQIVEEQQNDMREGLSFFTTFLLTFAGVALFVGAFIIHNTFSIVVAQRSRELALLRAVGASRRQVLLSVLGEAVTVGVVSSAAGIAAGIGVAAGLKALLAGFGIDIPAGGIVLLPRTVVVGLVVGVGVTLVATVLPARRAARIPPVAAMRDLALDTSGRSRVRAVAGVLVTAGGAAVVVAGLAGSDAGVVGLGAMFVFVGVAVLGPVIARPVTLVIGWPVARLRGITGRLARENAMRNPKRTAATASALMIGVGLVGFITIAATSASASIEDAVDEAFLGDFVVESRDFGGGGVSPDLAARLAEVPGVESAAGVRGAMVEVTGDTRFVTAVDPARLQATFDVGIVEGSAAMLAEPGTIAVHEDTAADRGLRLGDPVPVRFASTGEQQLRVAAVYTENQFIGSWVLGFPTFEANVPDQLDFTVLVGLERGVDADEARRRVEAVVATYPGVELQDRTEFKQSQADLVNQLLNLIYALLGLAIVIALIGIANTLALSVFERTRELGLLRAVGMTRRQMRSAVRWESVMIAVLGAVLGVVIAVCFAWAIFAALSDEGLRSFRIPVGRLTVIVVLAAVAGVLAAIPPARRAAKLDILRAITVE